LGTQDTGRRQNGPHQKLEANPGPREG